MHTCPRCGCETNGTYSDGGVLWSLCEDCYYHLYYLHRLYHTEYKTGREEEGGVGL